MARAFETRALVKIYPGYRLGPLDLDLEPGVVLGYVGPNGSGKTTTIHCLTGLLKADSGEIEILGHRNDPSLPVWKSEIGYVGDVSSFYERWTVSRNLRFLSRFYPNWSDPLAARLAARFGLNLELKVKHLSKGNRVKLALVAALAHSPRLLLLDEPTAGLDPVVRDEVLEALFEVVENADRAIFYSTHILSDISRLADELAFLVDGRLLMRTPKDSLTDKWRRISFRISDRPESLVAGVSLRSDGLDFQVVSCLAEATLRQLRELGAQNIRETRMSVEEITVQILRGGKNVASFQD